MSRKQVLGRNIGVVQNIKDRIQSSVPVAHMHGYQSRCIAQKTCPAGCGCQRDQLLAARIGASVVGYRHLNADHRRNQDDITLYTSGECGRRITVGAGQGIHRHSLFGQGTGLGHQVLDTSRHAVGSQKSYYGGNTVFEKLAELGFRDTGCRSLLSAASGDMHMQVNIRRNNGFSFQVIGLHPRKALVPLN